MMESVVKSVWCCICCGNFVEGELCEICGDMWCDLLLVCVVEYVFDLVVLECLGVYCGVYYVLYGKLLLI